MTRDQRTVNDRHAITRAASDRPDVPVSWGQEDEPRFDAVTVSCHAHAQPRRVGQRVSRGFYEGVRAVLRDHYAGSVLGQAGEQDAQCVDAAGRASHGDQGRQFMARARGVRRRQELTAERVKRLATV